MRDLSNSLGHSNTKKHSRISAMGINIALIVFTVALGLVYVFSINVMATEGLKIKELTTQLTKLEDEQRKLELQSSTLQSVSTIQRETQELNFVPSTNITYLRDDAYALK